MLSRPRSIVKYAGHYGRPLVLLAVLICCGSAGTELWAQNNTGQAAPAGDTDLKVEVLEVTTGSGSKTQAQDKPPLQIEVTDVKRGAGVQAPAAPASPGRPKTPAAAGSGSKKDQAAEPDNARHEALLAALDRWHYETLAAYNYNIPSLADPFMPILEVRGQPEVRTDTDEWAQRPPIERLELNQLKLVAITYLSERQGGAWASFEDGANNSYILSQSSKIGRNHGRITKIAPNEVWVEERGRSGQEAPKTTVIRMTTLDTQGLTRGEGGDTGGFQTLSVPGGE